MATPYWDSPNKAIVLLKQMAAIGYTGQFPVNPTEDSYAGAYSAEMKTIDTKGGNLFGNKVPKVTSGTLFLGKFETVMSNQLKSTQFGVPYTKKPLEVKGYYKYSAGEIYYNDMALDSTGMVDSMAMTAVLYEVSDYAETLDGTNIQTSDKIVAIGVLSNGDEKTEYTPFSIPLQYIKPYNSSKLYKFTVIFASSNNGAAFKGAPGSTLKVDNIQVVSE